ncbi:MAG: peptide chain release factor N(5)-glutamine methyltransferase [Gammaproteobacteria bacterium]
MNRKRWLAWATETLTDVVCEDASVTLSPHSAMPPSAPTETRDRDALRQRAAQEARWLLQCVLQEAPTRLWTAGDEPLSDSAVRRLAACVEKRRLGTPLAYVLGEWSFYGLDLRVSPDTLVPRADTELLVDVVLSAFPEPEHSFSLLDLGTGSGAIALAVAAHRPRAQVLGLDCSLSALTVARENAQDLGLERVRWVCGQWFAALQPGVQFDAVVSNPPYLAADDPHLASSIRFEPQNALISGDTGLEALKCIVQNAMPYVKPRGMLCVEHGYCQASAVVELMRAAGFCDVRTWQDLGQRDRLTCGRRGDIHREE